MDFFPYHLNLHMNAFTMAPQRHVVDVPRNLLPRLTWNSSSPRSTIPASHHSVLATGQWRQSLQRRSPSHRRLDRLYRSYITSRTFSTSLQGPQLTFALTRQTSHSRPSSESLKVPVRYNGVYVATFKPAWRAFHPTPSRPRDHHFDTLKFVQRLQAEGFSEEQAVAMMRVLNDIIQESIQNLTRTMVLREGESSFCFPGMTLSNRICTGRLGTVYIHSKGRFRQTPL